MGDLVRASVVVVSRERKELLSKTIDCLIGQNFPGGNFEIIIVDDGSVKDDLKGLVETKKRKFRNLKYVRQNPLGLASGRNNGSKNASSKLIAFTDNDCLPEKDWLSELLKPFDDGTVVGVEGKIVTDSPKLFFTNAPENVSGGKFIGANIAFRKEIIGMAGWFDVRMNFWREDSDFAFRAMEFGKIVFAGKAVVYHPLRRLPKTGFFRYLFFLRNEWVLFFKHPKKYWLFVPAAGKNLLQSAFAWYFLLVFANAFVPLDIPQALTSNLFIALTVFSYAAFSTRHVLFAKQANFGPGIVSEAAVFVALSFFKDLAYPLFLVHGLFSGIVFMAGK